MGTTRRPVQVDYSSHLAGLVATAPLVSKDRLIIDTSVESFSVKNSEHSRPSTSIGRSSEKTKCSSSLPGDVFSMPYLNRLKGLHDELAALDLTLKASVTETSNLCV